MKFTEILDHWDSYKELKESEKAIKEGLASVQEYAGDDGIIPLVLKDRLSNLKKELVSATKRRKKAENKLEELAVQFVSDQIEYERGLEYD